MQLILIKDGQQIDITAISGNYSRSDNVNGLGMTFGFDIAINPDDQYWIQDIPEPGDKLAFANNDQTVFEGIITDESKNGKRQRSYTAYDYGFYLNKNEVIAQFNDMAGDAAIKQLCGQFGIPVGSIAAIPTMIKQIYNGSALSDCIKDILQQATDEIGRKFRLEVRDNKLYIEDYTNLVIKAMYQPASNIAPFNVTLVPSNVSGGKSIVELKNTVVIASSKEKDVSVMAEVKDDSSITKFGMLRRVERVDDKDIAQVKNIAQNKLTELNKITQTQSLTLLGDDAIRAGRILEFDQPDIEMTGQYLVKNCTHSYSNHNHIMQLDLEAVK